MKQPIVFILLSVMLLLPLLTIPALAAEDAPLEDGEYDYTYEYDSEAGTVSVRMSMELAESGTYDFRKLFKDAADKKASVEIDLSKVKLYFTVEAIEAFLASGEPLVLTVKDTTEYPEENEDGEKEKPSEYRYAVSMGKGTFPHKSVRMRIRYTPERSDAVRVLVTDENGEAQDLKCACKERYVSFYPESFTEFTVTEAPIEGGIPKIVLLLSGALLLLLAGSAFLFGYLRKKRSGV